MTKDIIDDMFELRVVIEKLLSITEILFSEIDRLDAWRLHIKRPNGENVHKQCLEYVCRLICMAELQKSELLRLDTMADNIDKSILKQISNSE